MAAANQWFQWYYANIARLGVEGYVLYGSVRTERHVKISTLLSTGLPSLSDDSYYRLCPVSHVPDSGRGTAAMSIAVPALWFDFDVGKSDRYCPTRKEALDWLCSSPVGKIFNTIVESGEHGLHVYAIGQDPLMIHDQLGLRAAQVALLKVRDYLFSVCPWKLDSVFDLSRILRIPGSTRKDCGRPLQILQMGELVDLNAAIAGMTSAVAPLQFSSRQAEVISGPETAASGSVPAPGETRVRSPAQNSDASWPPPEPPAMKLMAALENDPGFAATWKRKSDIEDKTVSGYGFSLLNRMALLEWTDEEMVSTLYHWRKDQPYSREKSEHWYWSEITRVKAKTQRTVDERSRQTKAAQVATTEDADLDPMGIARAGLGWPGLERIEVDVLAAEDGYAHQERVWKFIGKTTNDLPAIIQIPTSSLLSKREMQTRVFDGVGTLIPAATLKKGWEQLLAAVNMAAIEATSDEDSNTAAEIRELVNGWLPKMRKTDKIEVLEQNPRVIVYQERPGGAIHWHWSALRYEMRVCGFESMRNDKLSALLKSYCKCTVQRFGRLPLWTMPQPDSSGSI
jgi:hypothetical protein